MTSPRESWRGVEGHPLVRYRSVDWAYDLALIQRLFRDYRQWIVMHAESGEASAERVRAGLGLLNELIEHLPEEYGSPRGDVLLWYKGESLIACGALRRLEPAVGEIKRVFIRPDYRGDGFGKPFVRAMISRSQELGYGRLRSYALGSMAGAHEFYQELGFRNIPAYWPHPASGVMFFERDLE